MRHGGRHVDSREGKQIAGERKAEHKCVVACFLGGDVEIRLLRDNIRMILVNQDL